VAKFQYQGKGQRGKTWHSEPDKNLTTSVLLYPNFLQPDYLFDLSKCVALGIAEALEALTKVGIFIKWPNDIFAKNQKLGGILIENQWSGGRLSEAIIGFGVNVFQASFPIEAGNPISLLQLRPDLDRDMDHIRRCINDRLEANYELLRSGKREEIDRAYHKRLYRRSELCRFELLDLSRQESLQSTFSQTKSVQAKSTEQEKTGALVFEGRIDSVDKFGQLVLEMNGQRHCFAVGDISYLL